MLHENKIINELLFMDEQEALNTNTQFPKSVKEIKQIAGEIEDNQLTYLSLDQNLINVHKDDNVSKKLQILSGMRLNST